MLASDGVIETMSPARNLFGFDGLESVVSTANVAAGAHAVLALILAALTRHAATAEQHDDVTLIVVRVLAGGYQTIQNPESAI